MAIDLTGPNLGRWAERLAEMLALPEPACLLLREARRGPGERPSFAGVDARELPLAASILKVLEAYASMVGDRGYHPERALRTLVQAGESHYDPEVVELWIEIVEDVLESGPAELDRTAPAPLAADADEG